MGGDQHLCTRAGQGRWGEWGGRGWRLCGQSIRGTSTAPTTHTPLSVRNSRSRSADSAAWLLLMVPAGNTPWCLWPLAGSSTTLLLTPLKAHSRSIPALQHHAHSPPPPPPCPLDSVSPAWLPPAHLIKVCKGRLKAPLQPCPEGLHCCGCKWRTGALPVCLEAVVLHRQVRVRPVCGVALLWVLPIVAPLVNPVCQQHNS